MKRLLPWALWAGCMALIGFLYESQGPALSQWLRLQVALQTAKNLPVRVLPGSVRFHVSPPGISVRKLRVDVNPALARIVPEIAFGEVRVSLSLWHLLQGRVAISEIRLGQVQGRLRIPTRGSGPSPSTLQIMNQIHRLGVPIETITVEAQSLLLQFPDEDLELAVKGTTVSATLERRAWNLETHARSVIARTSSPQREIPIAFRGSVEWLPDSFQVSNFFIKYKKSIVRVRGLLEHDILHVGELTPEDIRARTVLQGLLDLASARDLAPQLGWPAPPPASGVVRLSVGVVKNGPTEYEGEGRIQVRNASVDGFNIGSVQTQARLRGDDLVVEPVEWAAAAGVVRVDQIRAQIGSPYAFSAHVAAPSVNLRQLLRDVRVGDLPLELTFSPDLDCRGQAQQFRIECKGRVNAQGFRLWNESRPESEIVAVDALSGQGQVVVDSTQVQYQASATMPNSRGETSGRIHFEKGFDISYKGELSLKDVRNISDLKLEGYGPVEGTTSGDSSAAVFDLRANLKEAVIGDFVLGDVSGDVGYKKGFLNINKLRGTLGGSRYQADVNLDLVKSRIKVTADSDQVLVADGLKAFGRKFQFPWEVSGLGRVQARAEGPLNFARLSYDFRTEVLRGSVAGESFDRLLFHVRSQDGEVRTENVQMTKGRGQASLVGVAHPNAQVEVSIRGRGFRVEESEFLNSLGVGLAGTVNFDMKLTEHILAPRTKLLVQIPRLLREEQDLGSSQAQVDITSNTFEGSGTFLGGQIQGEFTLPYKESAPFRLRGQVKDFDFAWLASLLVDDLDATGIRTALSGQVQLAATTGGFWNSSGTLEISKLALLRAGQQMYLRRPVVWRSQGGWWSIPATRFEGDGVALDLVGATQPKKKMDFSLSGSSNLSIFYFLTPALSDLRGNLTTRLQVRVDENGAEMLGSGFLDKGLIKIRNLVHPFQNIRADIFFNQRKIVFNSLKAEFAAGALAGEGQLEIRKSQDVPLRFNAQLADAELMIPEGVRTKGTGDFEISGNWFPFILKGQFNAKSGLMSREFTDNKGQITTIRPSPYLPQSSNAESGTPLRLDLNLDIQKDFMVKNSLMDAPVYGNLRVQGTPANPLLSGTVNIVKGGKIYFRDNEFEVQTASATFVDGQTRDPRFTITAVNRFDDGTQTADINLLLLGSAQKPDLRLTSTPAMSQEEIVSLLALGVKPDRFERNLNETQQGLRASSRIGSAILADNAIKKEIKNKTGFEVDIGSTTQRNLVERGRNTALDDSFGVTVPKIVVSRQWTPKFGASASRTQGDVSTSNVKLRYKLNRSFSVVGSWETREFQNNVQGPAQSAINSDSRLGLDLEYKMEFK